jgi:signal recognition particle GTPase
LSLIDAFHNPNNELVRALRELLDAPTVEAARIVLDQKQALLLTDVAIELLRDFSREMTRQAPSECMYDPPYLGYHSVLLMGARL